MKAKPKSVVPTVGSNSKLVFSSLRRSQGTNVVSRPLQGGKGIGSYWKSCRDMTLTFDDSRLDWHLPSDMRDHRQKEGRRTSYKDVLLFREQRWIVPISRGTDITEPALMAIETNPKTKNPDN